MTKRVIPIIVNNFNDGKVLFVKGKINNREFNFLLDTGASKSIIDKRKLFKYTSDEPLKSLNVSSIDSDMDTYEIKIDKFNIGDHISSDRLFVVVDLINFNNTLSTNYMNVIDGILGNDIIFDIVSSIDFDKKIIILKDEISNEEG